MLVLYNIIVIVVVGQPVVQPGRFSLAKKSALETTMVVVVVVVFLVSPAKAKKELTVY